MNCANSKDDLIIHSYPLIAPITFLSFFSCTVTAISIIVNTEIWSKKRFHFVFWLLTFDALLCLSSLLPTGYIADSGFCSAQGILIQTFSLSGILWTGFIAIDYTFHNSINPEGKLFYSALAEVFLFSLMTALVPLANDFYYYGGNWCWYKNDKPAGDGYRFGFFYAIVWAVIAEIIVLHCCRYKVLRNQNLGEEAVKSLRIIKMYPTVLVMCYIPLSIARIAQSANSDLGNDRDFAGYQILASQIARLLGFFNSLVYGFSDGISEEMLKTWIEIWNNLTNLCQKSKKRVARQLKNEGMRKI